MFYFRSAPRAGGNRTLVDRRVSDAVGAGAQFERSGAGRGGGMAAGVRRGARRGRDRSGGGGQRFAGVAVAGATGVTTVARPGVRVGAAAPLVGAACAGAGGAVAATATAVGCAREPTAGPAGTRGTTVPAGATVGWLSDGPGVRSTAGAT